MAQQSLLATSFVTYAQLLGRDSYPSIDCRSRFPRTTSSYSHGVSRGSLRRSLCLSIPVALSYPFLLNPADALVKDDSPGNAYIQDLLRKSKENKQKNDEERLRSYQKKGYEDYFNFYAGSIRKGSETENDRKILEWLEKNK